MRSSPQVGLLRAISTMRFRRLFGIRGLPRRFDFQSQNSRKAFPCQSINVSGLTMTSASFQANSLDSSARVSRVASLARRGLALRSKYRASCI